MSLSQLSNALGSVTFGFARLVIESADAHYHVFGKHTMPIRKESEPTKVTVFNTLLFPISLPAHVLALTVFPLVGNSVHSFGQSFSRVFNFSVYDLKKPKFDTNVKDEHKRNFIRHAYGSPGYLLGVIAGVVAAAMATALRIICSSFVTAKSAYISTANLLLYKEDRITRFNDLQDDLNEQDPDKKRSKYSVFVLGLPGLIIGTTLGLLTSGIIGIGHIVLNSFKAGSRIFVSMLRSVGKWENAKGLRNDEFKEGEAVKTLLPGAPGLVIGAIIGAISIFIAHTAITAFRMTVSMGKGVLIKPKNEAVLQNGLWPVSIKQNTKSNWAYGFLGAPIGAITGAIAAALLFTTRVLVNSVISGGLLIKTMALAAWPGDNNALKRGIGHPKDTRKWHWRYFGAAPGLVIGAVIGGVVAGMIGLIQVIQHTAITAFRMTVSMAKGVWRKPEDIGNQFIDGVPHEIYPDRGLWQVSIKDNTKLNWPYGFLGALIGAITGAVAAVLVFTGRVFLDSARTAGQLIKTMALAAWPGDNKAVERGIGTNNPKDKRNLGWRYGAGAPGLVIGAIIGGVVAGMIGLIQVIGHSVITAYRLMHSMKILALEISAVSHTKTIPDKWNFEFLNIKNNTKQNWAFGFMGAPIGFVFGSIWTVLIHAGNVIGHSFKTMGLLIATMALAAWPGDNNAIAIGIGNPNDKRKWPWRFIAGAPGLIVGGAIGGFVAFAIGFGRTIQQSGINAKRLWVEMVKGVTRIDRAPHVDNWKGFVTDDNHKKVDKYGFGLPGYVFGALFGAITAGLILTYRVIANSLLSASQLYISMIRIALSNNMPERIKNAVGILDPENKNVENAYQRSVKWRHVIPSLSLILPITSLIGSISIFLIITARTFKNSWLSASRLMVSMISGMKLPIKIPENWKGLGDEDDRTFTEKVWFSLPGYLFGAIAGVLSVITLSIYSVVINSVLTAGQLIKSMTLGAWPGYNSAIAEGIAKEDGRNKYWRYLGGSPGLVIGAVIGGVSAFFIGLARTIVCSTLISFKVAHNIANKVRGLDNVGWSLRVAILFKLINAMTTVKFLEEPVNKYGFGLPGYLFGGIIGSLYAIGIMTVRVITHSILSGVQMFRSMIRGALPESLGQEIYGPGIFRSEYFAGKERHNFWRYGAGLPGILIAAVIGGISAFVIGVARFVYQSAINTKRVFVSMTKFASYHDSKVQNWQGVDLEDIRNPVDKHIFGAPGYLFGAISGALSVVFVIAGRVIANNILSAYETIVSMVRFALPQELSDKVTQKGIFDYLKNDDEFAESIDPRPRRWYWRHLIASPGIAIGAVLGAISAFFISIPRFVYQSAINTKRVFVSMTKFASYHDSTVQNWQGVDLEDVRNPIDKHVFGAPGYLFGAISGALSVVFVIAGRVIANNILSAYETIVSMVRFALPQKLSDKITHKGIFDYLKNDNVENADPRPRRWYWRHLIASSGIAIGAVIGAISAIFINIGRVAGNTMVTSWRMMIQVMRLGLPKDADYLKGDPVTQNWKGYEALSLENKTWGCAGFVFGSIMGIITLPFVAGGRFISNSLLSGFGLIMSTLSIFENSKASVFIGDKFPVEQTLSNDPRRGVQKYLFGAPGLVIGAAISAVAAVLMSVAFFIKHTVKSWQSFSGSMINGALNRPIFEGLGGDKIRRAAYKQAIGGLGYVLATVTTLPVALVIGLVKNSLLILGMVLAIVVSPFTALIKGIYLLVNPRFATAPPGAISTPEQALRNLFSHVNAMGNFRIGEIKDNQIGKKGPLNFIRRSFYFALQSTTEEVLTGILKAWNENFAQEFFGNDKKFDDAVQKVKDSHKKHIFISKADHDLQLEEIDNTAEFIKAYIKAYPGDQENLVKTVDENFYSQFKGTSWSATMFAGIHNKKDASDKVQSSDLEDNFLENTKGTESDVSTTVEREEFAF